MSWLDRVLGNETTPPASSRNSAAKRANSEDARALERYRYMVRTAPPEALERAHEEAFAKLTPEQRRQLLHELQRSAPSEERAATEAAGADTPAALARTATRAEYREPGAVERALRSAGGGLNGGGWGGGLGGSLLGSFAAGFAGSLVAQSFFSTLAGVGGADENQGDPSADLSNQELHGADPEADFSPEFGQGANDEGLAGGTGFEDDDFDVEV
jgi:hypothetical protein